MRPELSRFCSSVMLVAFVAFAAMPVARAAVLGTPETLVPAVPPECDGMHARLVELDEIIEQLPEVRAVRDAYDASSLGRRERAAMEAMSREKCFADSDGNIPERCADLMAEIDACATAFENSAAFKHVQALPEVVAYEQLSVQYSELCADSMPAFVDGEDCEPCEDDGCEDYVEDDGLPGTV